MAPIIRSLREHSAVKHSPEETHWSRVAERGYRGRLAARGRLLRSVLSNRESFSGTSA